MNDKSYVENEIERDSALEESFTHYEVNSRVFAKRSFHVLLITAAERLRGFIILPILAKSLGPAGLGEYRLYIIAGGFIAGFFGLNLRTGFNVLATRTKSSLAIRRIFSTMINIVILWSITLLILLIAFSRLLHLNELSGLSTFAFIYALSVLLMAVGTTVPQTFQKTTVLLVGSLCSLVFGTSAAIVLVLRGFGPGPVILAFAVPQFFVGLALIIFTIGKVGYSLAIDKATARWMIGFSVPLMFANYSEFTIQYLDNFFLAVMKGTSAVGLYGFAYSLCAPLAIARPMLNVTWYPTLAKLWEIDRSRFERAVLRVVRLVVIIFIGISYLLTVFSTNLVFLLGDRNFLPSAGVLPIISFAFMFLTIGIIFEGVAKIKQKSRTIVLVYLSSAIINTILNFLLIPRYGIVGAGIATLTAYLWLTYFLVYYVRRYFKMSFVRRSFFVFPLLCAPIFVISITLGRSFGFLGLLSLSCIGVGLILALGFTQKILIPQDVRDLGSLFRSLIYRSSQ